MKFNLGGIGEKLTDFSYTNAARLHNLGHKLTYGAVGLGVAVPAVMRYGFGIEDGGALSLGFIPAAAVFEAGETALVAADYATDVKAGETSNVKNVSYVTRIAAPLVALGTLADANWNGFTDILAPIATWVAGRGLTQYGNGRIYAGKKELTRRLAVEDPATLHIPNWALN